jgi:hypothetical protein
MNDNRRLTALAGAGVVAALVIAFAVAAHAVRADGLEARSTPHTLTFVLRPASAAALAEFQAPPTDWRIDSSVAALGG